MSYETGDIVCVFRGVTLGCVSSSGEILNSGKKTLDADSYAIILSDDINVYKEYSDSPVRKIFHGLQTFWVYENEIVKQ